MKTKLIIEDPFQDLDDKINQWFEEASNHKIYVEKEKPTHKVIMGSDENGSYYYELDHVISILYQQSIIQAYQPDNFDGENQPLHKPQTLRSALIFYR